jgi:epoxide hydrolase
MTASQVPDLADVTELDRGGHFPALEVPQTFVEELRAFFRPFRT